MGKEGPSPYIEAIDRMAASLQAPSVSSGTAQLPVIPSLVRETAFSDSFDYLRKSPLLTACVAGNIELVRLLCELGMNPNAGYNSIAHGDMRTFARNIVNFKPEILECLLDYGLYRYPIQAPFDASVPVIRAVFACFDILEHDKQTITLLLRRGFGIGVDFTASELEKYQGCFRHPEALLYGVTADGLSMENFCQTHVGELTGEVSETITSRTTQFSDILWQLRLAKVINGYMSEELNRDLRQLLGYYADTPLEDCFFPAEHNVASITLYQRIHDLHQMALSLQSLIASTPPSIGATFRRTLIALLKVCPNRLRYVLSLWPMLRYPAFAYTVVSSLCLLVMGLLGVIMLGGGVGFQMWDDMREPDERVLDPEGIFDLDHLFLVGIPILLVACALFICLPLMVCCGAFVKVAFDGIRNSTDFTLDPINVEQEHYGDRALASLSSDHRRKASSLLSALQDPPFVRIMDIPELQPLFRSLKLSITSLQQAISRERVDAVEIVTARTLIDTIVRDLDRVKAHLLAHLASEVPNTLRDELAPLSMLQLSC